MGYVEKATSVNNQSQTNTQEDKEKNKKNQLVLKILKNIFVSLFFYILSFIISFIPVVIDFYFNKLSNLRNNSQNIENIFNIEILSSCFSDSFKNIGTLYISISFLFILLTDFMKDIILNKYKIGTIAIIITVIEVFFGIIGLVLFFLVMSGIFILNINENQSFFINFTYLYLAISFISLIANTIIENKALSTHQN